MKNTLKKLVSSALVAAMAFTLVACGGGGQQPSGGNDDGGNEPAPSTPSGNGSYTEETMSDGWIKVTNAGGAVLGYSPESGIKLIEVDGYAFKDLNQNGSLDVYEDWRQSAEDRAKDLASQMKGEEIAPYLTHGGWGTFTTDKKSFQSEDNAGYQYIVAGGRAGVTRNVGASQEANLDHAKWSNLIQELCESLPYGIPSIISIDPNDQSHLPQTQIMAALMDPDAAFEIGKSLSKQYRAVGVSALLGPQVDVQGSPAMARGSGTYGEDPALSRDLAEAFVSGMQSSYDGGTDLGWGTDSVMCFMKHYAGAGATEAGRDDHSEDYTVFPNGKFEAQLIPFHDGAFNLKRSSTGAAAGIMTNYSVSYSTDGSLGEIHAGAFSQFKYDTLFGSGWTGMIVTDWGVIGGGQACGWREYTDAERIAEVWRLGMTHLGGYNKMDNVAAGYEELVGNMGAEGAETRVRELAYENLLYTFKMGLFENPYCSADYIKSVCWTDDAVAEGDAYRVQSVVMLKNDGTIKAGSGEKLKVYIPSIYNARTVNTRSGAVTPASWTNSLDLGIAEQYFEVVTDTVGEPSGAPDAENANDPESKTYTEDDIIRASAADVAACDLVIVGMTAPFTASTNIKDEEGNNVFNEETGAYPFTPVSLQYAEYRATQAKETSLAGAVRLIQFNDGYTLQTSEVKENRSYKNQVAAESANMGHLKTLQAAAKNAGNTPVIVCMTAANSGSMVWGEVEPLADAILYGWRQTTATEYCKIISGQNEPNGLLVVQQPKDMAAVEKNAEDLYRDCECYVDAAGNTYDFAYGLNWSGVIKDSRVSTYSVPPIYECSNLDFKFAN